MSTQVLRKLAGATLSAVGMTALGHSYKLIIRYVSMYSSPSGIGQHSSPQTSSLRDRKGTVLVTWEIPSRSLLASALSWVNALWIPSSGEPLRLRLRLRETLSATLVALRSHVYQDSHRVLKDLITAINPRPAGVWIVTRPAGGGGGAQRPPPWDLPNYWTDFQISNAIR